MGVAQTFRIELLVLVGTERMPPQHREDERGDDAHHRAVDVDMAELAAVDSDADHLADHREAAMDDFAQIEPREFREITGFRDDELRYRAGRRGHHFRPAGDKA